MAAKFPNNICRICTLIFDTDPLEIGRSPTDPTICIICEAHHMGTIELKTETITVEIFVLTYNRAELEDIVSDPQPWVRELRAVLNGAKVKPIKDKPAAAKKSKPAPSPVSKAKRGGSKMPHASGGAGVGVAVKPLLYCQHCGAQFITPGRHANHEANCIDNPVNHKSAAEE